MHVADAFTRSVSNGWGNADTGGAYTRAGGVAADYQVNGSIGTQLVAAGGNRRMTLASVNARDIEFIARVRSDKVVTGTGFVWTYWYVRQDTNNEYRFKVIMGVSGALTIGMSRRSSGGAETGIGSDVTPAAVSTYSANNWIWVRCVCRDDGSGTANLWMRAWADGNAEPNAWDFQRTDATAANQIAGDFSFAHFMSGTVTSTPHTMGHDDAQGFDPSGHDPVGAAGFFGG